MSETDVQALLEGVAADLDAAVVLEDVDLRLLAHTGHGDLMDDVRRSSIMDRRATAEVRAWFERCGIRRATGPVRTPANSELGALERWCIPVRFREAHLGYVWILGGDHIDRDDLRVVVETADQIAALLYLRRLATQADNDLLRLLLLPSPENEQVALEARAVGVHPHKGPIAVVVVAPEDGGDVAPQASSDLALAMRRAGEQAAPDGMLAGVVSGVGVVLAPLAESDDLLPAKLLAENARRLSNHVSHGREFVAAVGGATTLERASNSYAEARRALRVAAARPDLGPIAVWDELGVFRALALLPRDEVDARAVDPRVRRLLADAGLSQTAETFLDRAGNVRETALSLHVHRTTLYQRLERIKALYQLDLKDSGDHRLVTHLGLKLARVAGRL